MPQLLHIAASPNTERSYSLRVAEAFIESFLEKNPDYEVKTLRLFEIDLPEFDAEAVEQKYELIDQLMSGQGKPEPRGKWKQVLERIAELKAADKVIISSPMWNMSIPYKLKHYIDVVTQPAETFTVHPKHGYVGMVRGKPMQLILASSGEYSPGFPTEDDGVKTDFQRPYLEHIVRFLGFEDVRVIKIQPTTATPEFLEQLLEEKKAEAREAAVSF